MALVEQRTHVTIQIGNTRRGHVGSACFVRWPLIVTVLPGMPVAVMVFPMQVLVTAVMMSLLSCSLGMTFGSVNLLGFACSMSAP